VLLDLCNALESSTRIFLEEAFKQILQLTSELVLPVVDLIVDDAFVNEVVVLIEMWRKSDNQLVEKSTDTVDISPLIVSLSH
jgi:hypothetical protein